MLLTASMCFEFIETPIFTKRINELASLDVLAQIQADLIGNPERWPVIRGLHGARKGRVADPKLGRGMSGSFRYIYLPLLHVGRIHLLFIFGKTEQSNLSPQQVKLFGQIVASIKEETS